MTAPRPVPAGRTVVAAIDPFDPNVIWLHAAGGTVQDLTAAEAMTLADELQEQTAIGRLPKPALTCPNCGHGDDQHAPTAGCAYDNGDEFDDVCSCAIGADALPQVRALLAAERDALAGPQAWKAGDDEPEDVERVRDREGDVWIKRPSGLWRIERNIQSGDPELNMYGRPKGTGWEHLSTEYGPLTLAVSDVL